jgi:hypothetical protein
MATKTSPTVKAIRQKPAAEIVWLAVTVVEFVVIMGIVCLPLSAELLPRLATGAASGDRSASVVAATSPTMDAASGERSVSVVPAMSAAADAAPSPTYSVNRLPLPDASLSGVDLAVEGSSAEALTLPLGAPARSSGVQPSPRDIGGPAPAARRPQQARSDSATRKTAASPSRPAPTLTPPTLRDSGW